MEIASRSLERILQDKGIDVRDGELTIEMHFDPNTLNLRIIINGPKRVTNEIEMLWGGKTMNADLEFDPDEPDSIISNGLILPLD